MRGITAGIELGPSVPPLAFPIMDCCIVFFSEGELAIEDMLVRLDIHCLYKSSLIFFTERRLKRLPGCTGLDALPSGTGTAVIEVDPSLSDSFSIPLSGCEESHIKLSSYGWINNVI